MRKFLWRKQVECICGSAVSVLELAALGAGSVAAAGDQPQGEGISLAWLELRLHRAAPAQEEALADPAAVVGSGAKNARLFVSLKLIALTGGAA